MSFLEQRPGLGGVYRAVFLGVDNLGNVTCTVPSVTGAAPVAALAAGFNINDAIAPGSLGWVSFEGEDPSMPVWVGFAGAAGDWNRSWGVVPGGVSSNFTTGFTVATDVVSITPTLLANRRYKLSAFVRFSCNTGGLVLFPLVDGSNTAVGPTGDARESYTQNFVLSRIATTTFDSPGSGAQTYKLRMTPATSGTVTITFAQIVIEDDGPAIASQVIVQPPALSLPSNMAFGVLDWRPGVHLNATVPVFSSGVIGNTLKLYEFLNFTMQAGRRYAIRFSVRALGTAGGYFQLFKDGVYSRDAYLAGDAGASWTGINYTWELNGSDHLGAHTWAIGATSHTAATGVLYTDTDSASISDIGPSAGPITIVPAPTITVPGGWQTVGGTGVAFQNSWTNYATGWKVARYRLNGDRVEIEGLVKTGLPGTTVFTLPLGMRPTDFEGPFPSVANGSTGGEGLGRLDVQSDGQVIARASTGVTGAGAMAYFGVNANFSIL